MPDHLDSRGRIIAPGDVRIPPAVPPQPAGAARYVRQSTLDALAAPPPPPTPRPRSRTARAARMARTLLLCGLAVSGAVGWLARHAPHTYSRPVPARSVASFDSYCGFDGPAIAAVATDDCGGMTCYTLTCGNRGFPETLQVAR